MYPVHMQKEGKKEHWFVLGTRKRNSEVRICDDIRHQDNLDCFLPMVYRIRHVNNRRRESLEPAVRGFIFARGTEAILTDYITTSGYGLYFRTASFSKNRKYPDKLIVDDASMENFMRFIHSNQKSVRFYKPEEITWVEGDVVKVMIGSEFYEGQIVRVIIAQKMCEKKNAHGHVTLPRCIDVTEHASEERNYDRKKRYNIFNCLKIQL